jgi:hypothetical protein
MCPRCVRRFRAGKALDCEECEQALGEGMGQSSRRAGHGGTVIQPNLAVGVQTDRSEREAERVASTIMRMPDPNSVEQRTEVSERGGVPNGGLTVSGELEQRIRSLEGGRPLSDETRSFFEPRFDTDLGNVRIHTGGRADELARSINAEAFTTGRDIVFRRGTYRPESREGKELLAHELTHVVQQTGGLAGATQRRIHRTVSEDNISCANYPRDYPIFDVIGTDQPVQTIRNAEENAIRLLDRAVRTINAAVHLVRAQDGDPTVPGTIPEFMADAVAHNFELDPTNREVWTGGGMQTVPVIRERLAAAAERLKADTVEYICLSSTCDPDDYAKTWKRGGNVRNKIYLCDGWWNDLSEGEKASTVAHEVLHIYYWSFMKDEGVFGDAESYEQFIEDVWARRTRP